MINRDSLDEEFNLESQAQLIIDDINNATNGQPSINNPDKYIEENVAKANKLLDMVIHESENGNFSARMAEVGSLLINSINIAYEKILSKKISESSLQIKRNVLKLKERELQIKEKSLERPQYQQNNLIVGDRETVLRLLKGEKKLLEDNVIEIKEEDNE